MGTNHGNLILPLIFVSCSLLTLVSAMIRPPRPPHGKSAVDMKAVDFLFTATSPKTIHPNAVYPVILSLERSTGPVDFDIKVTTCLPNPYEYQQWPPGPVQVKNTTVETVAKGKATLQPETSSLVEIKIEGALLQEVYNISVVATLQGGSGQNASSDYGLAYLERKDHSIVIQTDKPIYKPGENVQFRVLFLDRFLKPVAVDLESKKVTVHILDAGQNIVKSWTGKEIPFQAKYGFVKGSLLLSKEPNLGEWSIEVVTHAGMSSLSGSSSPEEAGGEEDRQTHTFSVDQYVLPKFKVELKQTPSFLTYNASTFNVEVKSTYTMGKGVQGPCTVTFKPAYENYYQTWIEVPGQEPVAQKPNLVSRTKEIEGVGVFEFDLKEDLRVREEQATDYGMEYHLEASCTETVSGKVQNATSTIRMYKYPWKITSVNQPSTYKPGFPLVLIIKISKHDDTPVGDENPEALKIRHGFAYNAEEGVMFKPIPPTGLVTLTFTPPSNEMVQVNGVEVSYKGLVQWMGVPMRQVSPTNSYMMLTLLNNKDELEKPPLLVGESASILVRVNKPFTSLTRMVVARGVVVSWERVTIPEPLQEHTLTIPLGAGSEPEAHILVYTVLEQSDDVVADSIKIDVKGVEEKMLRVGVKDYSDLNKTAEPGANVSIFFENVISGGLLALRGVDQSVLLLKEDKDVDGATVKAIEQQFIQSLSSTRNWGGSDTFQVFEDMGINILTNALITKNQNVVYRQRYFGFRRRGGFGGFGRGGMAMEMAMDDDAGGGAMPMMAMAKMAGPNINMGAGSGPPVEIRVRKTFPETWLFTEMETDGNTKELLQMVPDTITSWIINAFQISPNEGLGVAKSSSKLTVFRPFFIVLDVPYSVVQGEILSLKVLVHNYLDHAVGAKVTLENPDGAFTLVSGSSEGSGNASLEKSIESLESQSVGVVSFLITPNKIGDLILSLKAVTSTNEAGDGLTQPLIVKPPGVKQSKSDAIFLNLLKGANKGPMLIKSMTAILPEQRVPGGDTLKFTVIGDLLGGTLTNLESLIQLPCGCGEQNMINFVPDLVVLDYFKTISSLTPYVKNKAVGFLESGYQRELTFKRYDGSYAAFGNSDAEGSTWLTAFVVRSFIGAKRYITIDDSVLVSALDFLIRQQSENGSFIESGYIHDLILQGGGGGSTHALTAFTLLTFIDAKGVPSLQDKENPRDYAGIVEKGLQWLLKSRIEDTYALVMVCYLYHVLDHPRKEKCFKRMEQKALTESKSGFKYWESNIKDKNHDHDKIFYPYWIPDTVKPASVEITAYALMTYLIREKDDLKDSLSIGRWLLKQRNENGGFISTQDTVVGLTALSKLAAATTTPDYGMKVKLFFQGGPEKETTKYFNIGKDDMSTVQEYFLPEGVTSVDVEAEGVGTALATLSWTYYTMKTGNNSAFTLDVKVEAKDKNRILHYTICTSYTLGKKSNMAILEVNTPTGYGFEQDELFQLKNSDPLIKRTELEASDSKLNIYYNSLGPANSCLSLTANRVHLVAKHSKASVTVYDYYDTTRKVTTLYDGPEVDVCQICSLDDSCKEHKCT